MPFHHVLITLSNTPNEWRCLFVDLSERELESRFLAPYRKGADILLSGEVIRLLDVRKVQVIRTNRNSETELKDLQDSSYAEVQRLNRLSPGVAFISAGRGYQQEDIAELGKDMTDHFVKGAPGHAPPFSFRDALNNPWVLTIGGGLLVAFLLAMLGLA